MAKIPNKTAAEIADITEKTWFTRYPLPQQIVCDCGTEFMAEFSNMCQNDYGLKRNLEQLGILSPMKSLKESIKLLEISSEHLMCLTSLTTIHGRAF